MQPDLPSDANATKLFEDKTPNAIILNRILLNSLHIAQHDDLVAQDGSDLIDMIVLLSRKLLSVWVHQQAYEAHEKALATKAAEWPIGNPDDRPRRRAEHIRCSDVDIRTC